MIVDWLARIRTVFAAVALAALGRLKSLLQSFHLPILYPSSHPPAGAVSNYPAQPKVNLLASRVFVTTLDGVLQPPSP
jgi:hypothetical protein